jgi:[ribosomal protein S18]-alanine N-acetyltransferase
MSAPDMDLTIRHMQLDDLDAVHTIDVLSFSLPWPERSFRFELLDNPNSRQWVAEVIGEDGRPRLAGVIVVWMIVDEAHIGTIAVHPDLRRMGIGRKLLETALDAARQAGMLTVFLEVRRSNRAAQELYKQYGFQVTGIRLRYYQDTGEDALLMELRIGEERIERRE